jgi:hypothetical protein
LPAGFFVVTVFSWLPGWPKAGLAASYFIAFPLTYSVRPLVATLRMLPLKAVT